jgi:hypothetical protein
MRQPSDHQRVGHIARKNESPGESLRLLRSSTIAAEGVSGKFDGLLARTERPWTIPAQELGIFPSGIVFRRIPPLDLSVGTLRGRWFLKDLSRYLRFGVVHDLRRILLEIRCNK